MSHLTRDELLRFAEGGLDPVRGLHLSACTACREEAEGLASILAGVRDVEVPEPAPAFWEHLATRVRTAIDAEPLPRAAWWTAWRPSPVVLGGALSAIVMAAVLYVSSWPVGESSKENVGPLQTAAAEPSPAIDEADEDWEVVVAAADAADWDDLQVDGLSRPGHADLVASELTAEEERALVRLLNDALAAPAGRGRSG
jgi:hypothetical protein